MAHPPVITAQDKVAWKNQAEWVEQTIRGAGSAGITNVELNKRKNEVYGTISRTVVSRVSELRDKLYKNGEAIFTEPVDEKAKVWKYYIGPVTPEYVADHEKRRKPKQRSDRFPRATAIMRAVETDCATSGGVVSAATLRSLKAFLADVDAIQLDKG